MLERIEVTLPRHEHDIDAVDADGGEGWCPAWELRSGITHGRVVTAWDEGVEMEGALHEDTCVDDVEQDALRLLAAVRAHREFAALAADRRACHAALLAALTSTETVDDPTLVTTHPTGRRALSADEAQRVAVVVADTLGGAS